MSQAENDGKGTGGDDALRRYIDKLEEWPEDSPPSPAELRAVRREIRLTQDDRDKLEILTENHIRRARAALDGGAYDQAAAELSRASQLRPMDPRPRLDLAEIYLQRSLERGYGRNDRHRAVKLAKKALDLNPGDPEAKRFLAQYRRMNADFTAAKYKKFLLPSALLIAALILAAWWQRDWFVDLFDGRAPQAGVPSIGIPEAGASPERNVPVDTGNLADGSVVLDIESASVGRRDGSSYFDIAGRIESRDAGLGAMTLLVRGRDSDGSALFAVPVPVRDAASPLLMPGDSEGLRAFRWLAVSETGVTRLEISQSEAELLAVVPARDLTDAEIVWDSPRPEGISLEAEIRDRTVVEAYDRQVLLMDIALENSGTADLADLSVGLSLDSQWPDYPARLLGRTDTPMARGERRVWSMALGYPLDANLANRPLTIRVTSAGR